MTSLCQGLRRSAGSGGEDPENQVEKNIARVSSVKEVLHAISSLIITMYADWLSIIYCTEEQLMISKQRKWCKEISTSRINPDELNKIIVKLQKMMLILKIVFHKSWIKRAKRHSRRAIFFMVIVNK